jgi:hypothetical protein
MDAIGADDQVERLLRAVGEPDARRPALAAPPWRRFSSVSTPAGKRLVRASSKSARWMVICGAL